nr:MAG TPA: hypothetical protein [Caudoviricetes sp.]
MIFLISSGLKVVSCILFSSYSNCFEFSCIIHLSVVQCKRYCKNML